MVAMKPTLVACLVLAVIACTDPYSFEPGDPTKSDPPPPPELILPSDNWQSDLYQYPQEVGLVWEALPTALFYQVEVYRDSLLQNQYLVYSNARVTRSSVTASFSSYGWYYWRVRAASREWNNYTDWSAPFRFGLPNPAK
jgi:hypothetical protein